MKRCSSYFGVLVLASMLTIGCTETDPDGTQTDPVDASDAADASDPADTPDPSEAEEVDRSDEVYERTRLLDVKIEMSPSDWDAMRKQTRTIADLGVTADCMPPETPIESPFTWFNGRAIVDGEIFQNVGLRKKGFIGSLSEDKPSIKIRFDKFVDDQEFLSVKRLTLNNTIQNGSFERQCLAYDLFAAVGVPAPRCNFAHVHVNGVDMGLYVNVESIKKPFIRQHFSDDDGNLYEGSISDFREGWTGTFNQKTNESEPSKARIDAIGEVLKLPDDQLVEELSKLINFDQFLNYWVMETLTAHWDGYSGNINNYSIYDDPTSGKIHFIPWGTDATFEWQLMLSEEQLAPRSINAAGLITRRLYLSEEGQQLYIDRLLEVLDAYWDADALEASIDQMVEIYSSAMLPASEGRARAGLEVTKDFIRSQDAQIRSEIETGPQPWTTGLRANLCGGVVEGTEGPVFGTEWQGFIGLADTSGELTYSRSSEEGSCVFSATLTGVASIEECGEGCTFARAMTVTGISVDDEDNSNCVADEFVEEGETLEFAQSDVYLGDFQETPFYALRVYKDSAWDFVEGAYSIVFGDLNSGAWYFGISND